MRQYLGLRFLGHARERGQALPMTIGVMIVLSLAVATMTFTVTTQQSASRQQTASAATFAVAEARLNEALGLLYNAPNPLDPAAFGTPPGGATSGYAASLSGSTWTITGSSTAPSPVAGAGVIRRTASMDVNVTTDGTPWQYLFADSDTGCMTISNNADIDAPIYARGDLCIGNNAHVNGSTVQVEGKVTIGNNGSIGSAASPVATAKLAGCASGGSGQPHPCSQADRVFATSLVQTTGQLKKPAIDLSGWYANAKPGPAHNCTVGSLPGGFDTDSSLNRSRPLFQLTPNISYDCQYWENGALVGRLTWNAASDSLTVLGTIFIDGSIQLSGSATYFGRATVYAAGQIKSSNNTHLCGTAACDATWSPNANLLVIVAGEPTLQYGIDLGNNTVFQGASYAVNDYQASNNVANWGPVIARQIDISNNAGVTMALGSVPPGAPGFEDTIQPVAGSWRSG
jgi:Tfp pilus assembly protein PilX